LVYSAFGFTVKSGWAAAVVVDGSGDSPAVVASRRIELSDPSDAHARQPYHAAAGTARKPGPQLDKLIAAVETFGRESVAVFIREQENTGRRFEGAGIVVGSLIDPGDIANDHIRIHALEGQLFRGIVKAATDRRHLASAVWRERDLYGFAATSLKRSESDLRQTLSGLGRSVGGPWRAEQKAAALAAWLVSANRAGSRGGGSTILK
jgi:hypothetical protein